MHALRIASAGGGMNSKESQITFVDMFGRAEKSIAPSAEDKRGKNPPSF